MNSCLYKGWVQHRRTEPVRHTFGYPVVYAYLDLDELDQVFKNRWFWSTSTPAPVRFRRADYFGDPTVSLQTAIREHIKTEKGHAPEGPIRVLSHLRHFGFSFNPVSFYYCFDKSGHAVETLVAEITNTPWNERHTYVLTHNQNLVEGPDFHFQFAKDFHISPFMSMNLQYEWRLNTPGRQLNISMKNTDHHRAVFDATLRLHRQPITGMTCAHVLMRYPMMSMRVLGAIYWQAFRLFLKGVPFHSHPSNRTHTTQGGAHSANNV